MNIRTGENKIYFPILLASIGLGIAISAYYGPHGKLASDALDTSMVCSLQSEVNLKKNEKNTFIETEMAPTAVQKSENTRKLQENTLLLADFQDKIREARKNAVSDNTLSYEKKKIDDLAVQIDARKSLEGLNKEVLSQENITNADKATAERLFSTTVTPAKTAYDNALAQYNEKKDLSMLSTTLSLMPQPTTTQINARRNIENLASPADPSKKPSAAQIAARRNVENLATARNTARSRIPARNNRNYQSALMAYNRAESTYNTALNQYNTIYASSPFSVSLTYAQLNTKLSQYNTALRNYQTALTTYNRTYSNSSTFTLLELNAQLAAYNETNSLYTAKLALYNTNYSTTINKTEGELLTQKNALQTAYETADSAYQTAFNTYNTISKIAYETALSLYTTAKEFYETQYPNNASTSDQLSIQYGSDLRKYNEFLLNKETLSRLLVEEEKYTTLKNGLNQEKSDLDILIAKQNTQLETLNTMIVQMENSLCVNIISCRVSDGGDNIIYLENALKHDMSKKIVSLGQNNPSITRYEVRYSDSNITFINSIYMDGLEFRCPDITIPTNTFAGSGTCEEALTELDAEERIGITCTGQYSFIVEKNTIDQYRDTLKVSSVEG